MKKMMMFTVVLAAFLAATANAAVIYLETFDGDSSTSLDPNADGATVAPTIAPEDVFWAAKGNDWLMSDGSIIGGTANNTFAGANLLPFEPEIDKVYSLSMDLDHNGTKYIGLGFSRDGIYDSSKLDTGYRFPQNGGVAYIMYGQGETVSTIGGINNANPIDNTGVYDSNEVNLMIIIDTTGDGSSFTVDFLIDGASITGGPQTVPVAISNINYAGIGAYGTRSGSADGSVVDNFRLVEGYDVDLDPSPENGAELVPTNPLTLSWTNLEPNNPADSTYVDVWFGTEPNKLNPLYSQEVTAGADVEMLVVDASVEGRYYWQVDSYIWGPDHINDANMIEGPLYSFDIKADYPPSSVDAGADKIAWTGEAVVLDGTVVDDGESALTYLWSADETSLADPNLTIVITDADQEDATVTITKDTLLGEVDVVTMTLAVSDGGNPTPVTATMTIDVYDTACLATRNGVGLAGDYPMDFNADCITDLSDFLVLADKWLDDYTITGAVDKP